MSLQLIHIEEDFSAATCAARDANVAEPMMRKPQCTNIKTSAFVTISTQVFLENIQCSSLWPYSYSSLGVPDVLHQLAKVNQRKFIKGKPLKMFLTEL